MAEKLPITVKEIREFCGSCLNLAPDGRCTVPGLSQSFQQEYIKRGHCLWAKGIDQRYGVMMREGFKSFLTLGEDDRRVDSSNRPPVVPKSTPRHPNLLGWNHQQFARVFFRRT